MKILMGCGLLLWLGVALAQAAPLAGHELQLALQQLEESAMPVQVFRERVAALVAGQAHYPPEVQGRLARLQCWALPGERDEEFRRAVAFAEQGQMKWISADRNLFVMQHVSLRANCELNFLFLLFRKWFCAVNRSSGFYF